MSSRNRYLTRPSARWRRRIHRQLAAAWRPRSTRASAISRASSVAGRATLRGAGMLPDYFEVRDARDAARAGSRTRASSWCSTAARLGKARLIDNLRVRAALSALELSAGSRRRADAPCRSSAQRACSRDQRRRIVAARSCSALRCAAASAWRVAQRHRDVAQPALVADAADGASPRCALETPPRVQREQLGQARGVQSVAHLEIRMRGRARELVPGAHQLAVVAAIDAIADGAAQFHRNRAAQLDGQIGDAAPRIELVGRDDGPRRAGRHAGRAAAAVRAGRRVDGQRQVGEDLAEEKIRAGVARDEVGVLADPAQPGIARQRLFEHRAASRRTRDSPCGRCASRCRRPGAPARCACTLW